MSTLIAPPALPSTLPSAVSPSVGTDCSIDSCRFCELAHGHADFFDDLYGASPLLAIPGVPRSHLVLMDAFPIGHLGGHVLIMPRGHVRSLAMVPSQVALRDAVQAVVRRLQRMFPDCWLLAFEHGAGEIGTEPIACGGCHVDHAHGHLVLLPSEVEFDEVHQLTEGALRALGWDLARQRSESFTPLVGLRRFVETSPYLHLGTLAGTDRRAFTYRQTSAAQGIPSQLLRRLIATVCGRSQPSYWNWKIALANDLQASLDRYRRDALSFRAAVEAFSSTE